MNGVTILSETIQGVAVSTTAMFIVNVIVAIIACVPSYVIFYKGFTKRQKTIYVTISVVTIITASFIMNFFILPQSSQRVSTYEVIVDETVSMEEFTSKYEIIEQRGKIYVVQEK